MFHGLISVRLPIVRIPYPHTSIQTSSGYPVSIKSDSVDLGEMTRECSQQSTILDAPHFCHSIVASRNYDVALNFETTDARLVTD
jgi:hypothetical protein